ncbi:unnamed protein product [Toxocara canis]|uniref:DUF3883 domain-containing protein n=1 Tax=Toxocara canis TaxID=6265 RepID=A0A183VE60_TOXCA|nr:unnamed protein product [Toxocara canis]
MSNDSGYIVSILDSSSFGRYGGGTDLPIHVMAVPEDVTRYGALGKEPLTTLVALDFVLFKRMMHFSMRTSMVLSARWKNRMCRTLLRCFDNGAILNAGAMLLCVMFTRHSPPVGCDSRSRRISFQVLRVPEAGGIEWAGVVLQEITVWDARSEMAATNAIHYALLPLSEKQSAVESHGLKESLFFTEVVLDIEKLLFELTPSAVQRCLHNHHYVGLIDYEVDVVGCDGYSVYVMVSVLVEVKGPGSSGTNRPYIGISDAQWNTHDGMPLL